ncbi:MAG: hypothetical protein RBS84_03505 [Kiritimatiellia bacterium]|jgi:hypothetical protein|nr:hypothetical protein [Kiritimatiellia bacterium]
MKAMKLLGLLVAVGLVAGAALAATYTDAASNYTEGSWTNGSTGGTGFEPWSIVSDDFGTGWAGCGIWDSSGAELSMGFAFGFVGKVGYVNIDRDFTQALNVGDSFALDFGVNWDSDIGNKGFSLFANGVEVINVNHGGFPGEITVNENPGITNYGTGTMRWTFTQVAADQISVYATGRDGTETFATTVTAANAYGYLDHVRFYSSGLDKDAPDQRQSYFDNLTLEQEGTPPPAPMGLSFTSGTWDPAAIGDYEFVLAREGAVGDDIVLSSSNTNAVTVPATATFVSNSVSFNVTVVSLTAGPATIIASNSASGAWAEYGVTPVAPVLTLGGPWEVFVLGPATYTLERSASVEENIVLSSSDTGVLTVPADLEYAAGSYTSTFPVTVIGYGSATITASNATSGAWATFDVTVAEPRLELTGPATAWVGDTKTYTVTRFGPVGNTVNLSSTDTNVMTVPATVDFPFEQNSVTFQAVAVAVGGTTLSAVNDDVGAATLAVTVTEVPNILAYDEAGNYTPATFISTANEGFGFGAWNLWNTLATLGDSTAGGGGDLNSTNGYSFRFMGDGAGGWCNGERQFDALQAGDVLSFTFTYNWDGGGRGVDIFCSTGQFANLIDVSPGNTFKVNGETISTDWSPAAVVEVEITQQADGIQMSLVRSVDGVPNLTYTTNILNPESATGVSMYCGGYTCAPEDNVNYAIFMNDLQIAGEERTSLTFSSGTWNPSALGDYSFELTRSGAVDNEIVLTSDNTAAVTVPASVTFAGTDATVSFMVTVVSLTNGDATVVASNAASGLTATYTVKPYESTEGPPFGGDLVLVGGDLQFTMPTGYTLGSVLGADCALVDGDWDWQTLSSPADYTVEGNVVTITATGRKIIRIGEIPD